MMPTATNNNETTTLSPSATATWPPQSLAQHAQSIANHAEDLEVAGVDHNPLPHMAALLYLQDYQAAHYLYLRQPTEGQEQQQMLQPWYAVAVAALQNDVAGVWSTLAALTRAAAPPPAATYAREIAHAFRVACLSQWKEADEMIPPSYYVSVLGFASRDELVAFWHQHVVVAVADGNVRRRAFSATSSSASNNNTAQAQQQQQQIVAFLESRLTVESSSSSSSASAKPPAAL